MLHYNGHWLRSWVANIELILTQELRFQDLIEEALVSDCYFEFSGPLVRRIRREFPQHPHFVCTNFTVAERFDGQPRRQLSLSEVNH
jgi:hypothetical protein